MRLRRSYFDRRKTSYTTKKARIGETHCCQMRRQVKVGVQIKQKYRKEYWEPASPLSRRNERGLGINEETALLSPWQWRFEVDRMQSRFASSVYLRPCQPARFWKSNKSFVYYLKAVALIGLRGHRRGGKRRRGEERSLAGAALSKIDAGVAAFVREVSAALLLCFYSGRRDMCVCCCLCFAGAFTLSKSNASPQ